MKRCLYFFTSVALIALLFSGCEKDEEPFNETNSNLKESAFEEIDPETKLQEEGLPDYFVAQLERYKSDLINTYNVTFTGRVVKGTGENVTTTFNYTVSGTNQTPQLDSFSLVIPDCAGTLSSWEPQQASGFKDGVLKWNNSVAKDGSQNYSITFSGEVPLGIINSTVTRGSIVASANILGPCNGVYSLSGNIYVDADNFGVRDASESGIPSVPVGLFNHPGDSITTVSTNGDGFYSFMVLEGNYKVAVGEDFLNNTGYTPIDNSFVVLENVTKDFSEIDFGYTINSSRITEDLDNGVLRVNTEPTKYWVMAFKNIDRKKEVYSRKVMMEFLVAIEGLFLPEPFQFGDDKIKNAQKILERPIKSDLDEFLQQLLTAQLNVVSGKGALKSTGELNSIFNDALLIYGEAVACRESGNCPEQASKTSAGAETKAVNSNDTRMFLSFNGSGGVN